LVNPFDDYVDPDPNPTPPIPEPTSLVTDWPDSKVIDGVPVLKFAYYKDALEDLPEFGGFSPRWTIPKIMFRARHDQKEEPEEIRNITATLLVIDTAREVKIGLAPHFPPIILDRNEIMMSQLLL